MARVWVSIFFTFLAIFSVHILFQSLQLLWKPMTAQKAPSGEEELTTRWAVLVAGSSGYKNYRHQADVCHAYQILRKGGLKDENIVVFMYDDLAYNPDNPRPGIIINHPTGQDVYVGVPKDYTGNQVTIENLFAVLLGNKSAVRGGSGKVVDSKSNDKIFVYYFDHGGPSVLGMPNLSHLFADDFINLLQKRHESKKYKEMVIYVEACKSESIFEGVIPQDLNIYVITASSAKESSWRTYCLGMDPSPPPDENSNLKPETIGKKYQMVKERASKYNTHDIVSESNLQQTTMMSKEVKQSEAGLLYLWARYKHFDDSSKDKAKVLKEIKEIMKHRFHVDTSVDIIGKIIFGYFDGPSIFQSIRPGQPFVDDVDCFRSMLNIFETHCGPLTFYDMKHSRAFASLCNRGISMETMKTACISACAD